MTTSQPRLATYFWVYAALLAGLAATVGLSYVHLGRLNLAGMLLVAFAKAALVVLFFMHVRYSPHLTWLAVTAGMVWLGILLAFVLMDYSTRDWLDAPQGRHTDAPPPVASLPVGAAPRVG